MPASPLLPSQRVAAATIRPELVLPVVIALAQRATDRHARRLGPAAAA